MYLSNKKPKLSSENELSTRDLIGRLVRKFPGVQYTEEFPEVIVVTRADVSTQSNDKVVVISGQSGHEHAGFVGKGMLSAAICGGVLASHPVQSIIGVIKAVTGRGEGSPGCLLIIVTNNDGDSANYKLAYEEAKSEGYKVEVVTVGEECALPPEKPQCSVGSILVHKVAGAAADMDLPLTKVATEAKGASIFFMQNSLVLPVCKLPGQGAEKMELDIDIHGELGADEAVDTICSHVKNKLSLEEGTDHGPIVLMVTRFGATPLMGLVDEVEEAVSKLRQEHGLTVERVYRRSYMTSIVKSGLYVTLMKLNEYQILKYLDAPTTAPYWPVSVDGVLCIESMRLVFLLLPAKDLARFTTVSPIWDKLIRSPEFISDHLKSYRETTNTLILASEKCYHLIGSETVQLCKARYTFKEDRTGIWSGFQSCNGIILYNSYEGSNMRIVLWNPVVNRSKLIEIIDKDYQVFGLGHVNDDYTIIKILYAVRHEPNLHLRVRVELYSLAEGVFKSHCSSATPEEVLDGEITWNNCCSVKPPNTLPYGNGVYLQGSIHWLATKEFFFDKYLEVDEEGNPRYHAFDTIIPKGSVMPSSIVYYNFETGDFGEFAFPVHQNNWEVHSFQTLDGMLSAMLLDTNGDLLTIWAMKRYGDEGSWEIIRKIRMGQDSEGAVQRPIGFTCDGNILCYGHVDDGDASDPYVVLLPLGSPFTHSANVIDHMDSLGLFTLPE